jgi:hypothetical protein
VQNQIERSGNQMVVAQLSKAPQSLSAFLKNRLAEILPDIEAHKVHLYMMGLARLGVRPPLRVGGLDWQRIENDSGVDASPLKASKSQLKPLFELLMRELRDGIDLRDCPPIPSPVELPQISRSDAPRKRAKPKRRRRRRPVQYQVVEFPEPKTEVWTDVPSFQEALALHMDRHSDKCPDLFRAVVRPEENVDIKTIFSWRRGTKYISYLSRLSFFQIFYLRYRITVCFFIL